MTKKIAVISYFVAAAALLIFGGFAIVEPQSLEAVTATTSVSLTVSSEISLTPPASISLSPNITMTQQSSVGSSTWNVKTSDAAGYTLKFNASTTNALCAGGNCFTDVASTSPITWSVGASVYQWGYGVYGTDVATSTWGNASACGTAGASGLTTSLSYAGFATSSALAPNVAVRNSATPAAGINTTHCIAAEEGDSVFAPDGSYSAIVTGTAVVQ